MLTDDLIVSKIEPHRATVEVGTARPTMADLREMLESRGWTFSESRSIQQEDRVIAFSEETVPGTAGVSSGSAAWYVCDGGQTVLVVTPAKPRPSPVYRPLPLA